MNGIGARIEGRLGQDARMFTTADGRAMLAFSVAVTDYYQRDGATTTWVRTACFDQVALQLDGRLLQGDRVLCEGRLVVKLYEGQPDIELYAWDVQIMSDRQAPRHMPRQASGPAASPGRARR